MKKVWKIVGAVLFWGAVVAYFVCATLLRVSNERERRVERIEVVVTDADQRGFITPEKVLSLLQNEGIDPIGQKVDSVDLASINHTIEEYCFTADAKTFVDYSGTLTIKVSQRAPLLRIRNNEGYDFYLTRGGYVLPVEPHATLNLPIVTGNLTLPFGKSFRGSLAEWFEGGEKKYRENYNFLSKLINFVVYLEESEWEGGKCVQIDLVTPSAKATKKGAMMGFFTLEDQTGQVECLLFPRIFERYGREIQADQPLLVHGRLSIREDEDAKLVVDAVESLLAPPPKKDERTDAQRAKDAPEKLYLRLSRAQIERVQAVLLQVPGQVPVYLNLPAEKITLLCPREIWVRSGNEAMEALKDLLPQEDMKVVLKQ